MSSGPRLILTEFIYSLFIGQTIESVYKKCEMFPVASRVSLLFSYNSESQTATT